MELTGTILTYSLGVGFARDSNGVGSINRSINLLTDPVHGNMTQGILVFGDHAEPVIDFVTNDPKPAFSLLYPISMYEGILYLLENRHQNQVTLGFDATTKKVLAFGVGSINEA